jgi:deoxycytidylate deaminase
MAQTQQPQPHYSNKVARLAGFAADESRLSIQQFKHGAILCKSGKSYRRNICCSIHAEMGTVTKFLNSYIKIHATRNSNKIKRKLNKFSICVVRSIIINGQMCYANSTPCSDCIKKLQTVGLKNIMYSDENGNIVTEKIATFNTLSSFITGSMKKQKFIENMRFKSLI